MKKTLATTAGAALTIGVGLAGFGLTAASAQEVTPTPEEPTVDVAPDNDGEGRRGHRGSKGISNTVLEDLGLTADIVSEGRAAGQSLGQTAEANGVSSQALVDALIEANNARFADAENLPEGFAEQVAERIEAQVEREPLTEEERAEKKAARAAAKAEQKEALADTLGLSVEDLTEALRSGETLADIATANGVAVDTVIDQLVADAQAKIDAKVADGSITAEEAAEKSAQLEERITTKVNEGHSGRDGRRGHRNGGPARGNTDVTPSNVETAGA